VLFLVALGFGFGPIYAKAGGGDYIQFLSPGVIAMSILFTGMFTGIEVIWDRQFGFLKETLVAPVSRSAIMFGKTLGGATVATIQGIIVFVICLIAGFRIAHWWMLPFGILFMFLIALLFTALGTTIASRLQDMQAFPLIMNFLIMPIFFLSGALFPLNDLPSALNIVIKLNPLSYGVDGLRHTLAGVSNLGVYTDVGVIVIVSAIIIGIGTIMFAGIEL